MKIYHYHPVSKEFVGESEARVDPLEKKKNKKIVYLMPANTTTKKPLPTQAQKACCFDEYSGQWVMKPDHRGERYFDPDTGKELVVNEIGIIPYVKDAPETAILKPKWDGSKWVESADPVEAKIWLESNIVELRAKLVNATGLSIKSTIEARLADAETRLANL